MSHTSDDTAALTDEALASVHGGAGDAFRRFAEEVINLPPGSIGIPITPPGIAPGILPHLLASANASVGPEYKPPTDPNDPRSFVFPE